MVERFDDRVDAGRRLAGALARLDLTDPVVLGLPRGGVPVAAEVARVLGVPFDVVVARKVGAPGHAELGIGAIAEGGIRVAEPSTLRLLGVSFARFGEMADREQAELVRRVATYRAGRPLPALAGRDVLVVDDGLATGVTAKAALLAVRRHSPRRVVLGVPVCVPDSARRLEAVADIVTCVLAPVELVAVGRWYRDFTPTSDDEVLRLLAGTTAGGRPEEGS